MSKLDLNTKFLSGVFYSSILQKFLHSNPEQIIKMEYLSGKSCLKESSYTSASARVNNKLICSEQKFYLLSDKNVPSREVPETASPSLHPILLQLGFILKLQKYQKNPQPSDSTVHCPAVTCPLAPFHAQKSGTNPHFLHFWGSSAAGALASPAKQSSIYQKGHEDCQSSTKVFSPFKISSLHHI